MSAAEDGRIAPFRVAGPTAEGARGHHARENAALQRSPCSAPQPALEFDANPPLDEVEVLALVGAGANRQTGIQLFVSEKTVSVHISNMLPRPGVTRRIEVSAVAQRLGMSRRQI